jgi:hypothetical protein
VRGVSRHALPEKGKFSYRSNVLQFLESDLRGDVQKGLQEKPGRAEYRPSTGAQQELVERHSWRMSER